MVKAVLDEIYSIAPVEGFKLLLVAAIAVHAHVAKMGASSHPIVRRWHDNIHITMAEFCNAIGLPAILDDIASEDTSVHTVSLVYMPVDIPPTPSFGSDLLVEETPSSPVPSALVIEVPMPIAHQPCAWPHAPAPPIGPAVRQGGHAPLSSKGKHTQGQALAASLPTKHVSFAAAAAMALPKPAPALWSSLVLSIPSASLANSLLSQSALHVDAAAFVCMEALGTHPSFTDVWVSATRWMPKGNLVIFGGPDTSQEHLLSASHILLTAILAKLSALAPLSISAYANVKWSKVLISSVPLGSSAQGPAFSVACYSSLVKNNLSYKALKVTQMPSWVRKPSAYNPTQLSSSLVVAFEDPDGTLACNLIRAHHLYIFGTQATVKKWKYRAPTTHMCVACMVDARLAAKVVVGEAPRPSTHRLPWGTQTPAPIAMGAASSSAPPMPGLVSDPLMHSPPTTPLVPRPKKSRKKVAIMALI